MFGGNVARVSGCLSYEQVPQEISSEKFSQKNAIPFPPRSYLSCRGYEFRSLRGRKESRVSPSGKQISKTYLPQNRVLLLMCVAAQGFGNGAVCILRGLRVFLGYITLGNGRDKQENTVISCFNILRVSDLLSLLFFS